MSQTIVTTSWDDDHRSGLRVAEFLSAFALRGTFYLPTGELGKESKLSTADLRNLTGAGFEIGAHTVSHAILTELPYAEALREVSECKEVLQQALSTDVKMFCYPKGRFNSRVIAAVKQAGYVGARTTQMLAWKQPSNLFTLPVTVQAYPHARGNYVRALLRTKALKSLLNATPDLIAFEDWLQLGKKLFDRVLKHGGTWHLYGHPWEIEKLNLWGPLRQMLEYVSGRNGVIYATNIQMLELTSDSKLESRIATSPTARKLS